jgi:hypothetical protein
MRSTSFVTFTVCALSATVLSAPTPSGLDLNNIIGSVTNPGAGNDNLFKGNLGGNGVGLHFFLALCTRQLKLMPL